MHEYSILFQYIEFQYWTPRQEKKNGSCILLNFRMFDNSRVLMASFVIYSLSQGYFARHFVKEITFSLGYIFWQIV